MASNLPSLHSMTTTTAPDGKQVEEHKYCFFSAEACAAFGDGRSKLVEASHPNLCKVYSAKSAREEQLNTFLLQLEQSSVTVESASISRSKAGRSWNNREVVNMLKDLSAALAYLDSQDLCCVDLSPNNVQFSEGKFKLRMFAKKGTVHWPEVRATALSPEARAMLADWLMGNEVQYAAVDFAKASVYSLALLALRMVFLELNDEQMAPGAALEKATRISTNEKLRTLLLSLLSADASERPTPSDLSATVQAQFPITPQELQVALNSALGSGDMDKLRAALNAFTVGLVVSVEFPCSACKASSIQLGSGKGMLICEKHLICSVPCLLKIGDVYKPTASLQCPVCVRDSQPPPRKPATKTPPPVKQVTKPKKVCPTCQTVFYLDIMEQWRVDLVGSPLQPDLYCSRVCLPSQRQIPQSFEEQLEAEKKFNSSLEGMNNRQRRLHVTMPLLSLTKPAEVSDEQHANCIIGIKRDLACAEQLLLNNDPELTCHFCSKALEDVGTGRWVLCGKQLTFVCSTDCFRSALHLSQHQTSFKATQCPTCEEEIAATDIEITLGTGKRVCTWCRVHNCDPPPCRHQTCASCMRMNRGCMECSFRRDLERMEHAR